MQFFLSYNRQMGGKRRSRRGVSKRSKRRSPKRASRSSRRRSLTSRKRSARRRTYRSSAGASGTPSDVDDPLAFLAMVAESYESAESAKSAKSAESAKSAKSAESAESAKANQEGGEDGVHSMLAEIEQGGEQGNADGEPEIEQGGGQGNADGEPHVPKRKKIEKVINIIELGEPIQGYEAWFDDVQIISPENSSIGDKVFYKQTLTDLMDNWLEGIEKDMFIDKKYPALTNTGSGQVKLIDNIRTFATFKTYVKHRKKTHAAEDVKSNVIDALRFFMTACVERMPRTSVKIRSGSYKPFPVWFLNEANVQALCIDVGIATGDEGSKVVDWNEFFTFQKNSTYWIGKLTLDAPNERTDVSRVYDVNLSRLFDLYRALITITFSAHRTEKDINDATNFSADLLVIGKLSNEKKTFSVQDILSDDRFHIKDAIEKMKGKTIREGKFLSPHGSKTQRKIKELAGREGRLERTQQLTKILETVRSRILY